ncbi:MAG: sigma-70 family RNA polymerase sigma factor [Ruminococcaceae bacterium]|nr:sigma-70 family RNA polymerase sigma factor [Oscillospiraceae bacterium]
MDTKDLSGKDLQTDEAIIELYWQRNECAIQETDKKYGKYLLVIADNILHNRLDSEECLNDTYLGTWNRIPPTRPASLQAFLTRIMRNISIGRFRQNTADKRIPSELVTSLGELEECIAGDNSMDEERAARELAGIINQALHAMKDREQYIFVCRYYYADKISAIATSLGVSEVTVNRTLAKLRRDLKARLDEAGYTI